MKATKIVVGVDESPGARKALQWARDEARLRNVPLEVLHAYDPSSYTLAAGNPSPYITPRLVAELQQYADRVLEDLVCGIDDVEVERVAIMARDAARPLIKHSRDAELLVLGSRGYGGFTGLLLGSVSQKCVRHAYCPVAIIPTQPEP